MGRPRKQPLTTSPAEVIDDLPFIEDGEDAPLAPPRSQTGINPELVATLEKCPHINCVWMDEEGNWFFAEKPGFTAYSRERILNG